MLLINRIVMPTLKNGGINLHKSMFQGISPQPQINKIEAVEIIQSATEDNTMICHIGQIVGDLQVDWIEEDSSQEAVILSFNYLQRKENQHPELRKHLKTLDILKVKGHIVANTIRIDKEWIAAIKFRRR